MSKNTAETKAERAWDAAIELGAKNCEDWAMLVKGERAIDLRYAAQRLRQRGADLKAAVLASLEAK